MLIEAVFWVCAATPDEIAWYVAWLFAAADWASAAAPDGIAWYDALLFAAVGWVCVAAQPAQPALDENALHVAVLHSAGGWA